MPRSVIATDDFNRASLGTTNWGQLNTANGEVEIRTSTTVWAPYSGGAVARYTSGTFSDDQYAELTIAAVGNVSGDRLGVIVRASADADAARDYYAIDFLDNAATNPGSRTWRIVKVVNGTLTQLATGSVSLGSGDKISLEVIGTTLRGYINTTQLGSDVTDSDLSTGRPGIWGLQSGGEVWGDSFEAGDVTAASLEQEGHRWRDDDGDEDAATWLAAQDVANVFRQIGANTRLRLLINATLDPASAQYRLEYRLSGGTWGPVLTAQPSETPATVISSTLPTQANPTTTFGIVVPAGVQGGDLLEVTFISRDHTSGTPQPTVSDNESGSPGWTQKAFSTNRQVHVFYRRATGALGAVSATIGSTITVAGCVGSSCGGLKVIRGALGSGDPYTDVVFEENASANETHATFTPANANSLIGFVVANATNDTLPVTVMAAATLGTFEPENFEDLSTGGSDCYIISSARGSAGGPTATGQFSWSQTNSATISLTYAIRPAVPLVHSILMAASANIGASGEATTAQLSAPAGKTTSDFVAGRIQDDENPADAVDITTDDYTELEWCIEPTSGASNGEVYEFRATIGGAVFASYATTPTLTVGDEPPPGFNPALLPPHKQTIFRRLH